MSPVPVVPARNRDIIWRVVWSPISCHRLGGGGVFEAWVSWPSLGPAVVVDVAVAVAVAAGGLW